MGYCNITEKNHTSHVLELFIDQCFCNYCPVACMFLLRMANIAASRAYILSSNLSKSLGTTILSKQLFVKGLNRYSPPKVRTHDKTTYVQFCMNDQETIINWSFDMPCSLWPVVASFRLTGNWEMTTPFSGVCSLTASSKATCAVAVTCFAVSLKHCIYFSLF